MAGAPWLSHRAASRLAITLAVATVLLAVIVLIGWDNQIKLLIRVNPNWSSMKVNTALCLIADGLALVLLVLAGRFGWRWARALSGVLCAAVALVVCITLLQYPTGWDFRVDQWLMRDVDTITGAVPGRMSIITGLCLLGLSLALLIPQRLAGPWPLVFQLVCSSGLIVGYLVCTGYLFGMRVLIAPVPGTSIALHTAMALVLLFSAALMSRPDRGWVQLPLRPDSVGLMTRILLPVLVLLPWLLGWLALESFRLDVFAAGGAIAVLVATSAVLMTAVALTIAGRAARLDDALKEQERIYATLLGNTLDAFVMIDERGRVLEWNPQAEQIFGWSRREVLERPLDELVIPEEHRAAHRVGMARFLETGDGPVIGTRMVLDAIGRDQRVFPVELVIVPVQLGGHWRFGGFLRDISEQLATEEQLRQSQKMEAIGQLTGGVAHDMNNLLTVVIGSLDIIGSAAEPSADQVPTAMRAAERCAALVQRLLAFARRQALAPEQVDLGELVQGMHDLLVRTLGEGIEISLHVADNAWLAFADPGQIENALLNLALNARDAMKGEGRLTIEIGNAHLDDDYVARNPEVDAGEYVALAVSDTGHGMSDDVVLRAVDPFFTTKEAGKGSGLGLSMIYGFTRQSGGHLKIYSESGHGTTVRLYLPRAHGDAGERRRSTRTTPSADVSGRGERILAVEDDGTVRAFVITLLGSLGYEVVAARDGREALDRLTDDEPFDLLFTDVVLPGGMSGRDLADAVLRRRPGMKVLFTSGYTQDSIVHHGRLDPDVEFIAKPYKTTELATRLRAIIESD